MSTSLKSARKAEPQGYAWTMHHITQLFKEGTDCAANSVVIGKSRFDNVRHYGVIPLPLGRGKVYDESARTFNDWSTISSGDPEERDFLPQILKAAWLALLVSTAQLDAGTPAYDKKGLLSKRILRDFEKWSINRFNKPNPSAYANRATEACSKCFDVDVAKHLAFLRDETGSFAASKKPDQTVADDGRPYPDPPKPKNAAGTTEETTEMKFNVVLQPCRGTGSDVDTVAGFLVWVFVVDPNYDVDACRQKYAATVSQHLAAITKEGGRAVSFPPRNHTMTAGMVNLILSMKTDHSQMLSLSGADWKSVCDGYEASVLALELVAERQRLLEFGYEENENLAEDDGDSTDREDEEGGGGGGRRQRDGDDSDDDSFENPYDLVKKLKKNNQEDLGGFLDDTDSKFHDVFTPEKAYAIAKSYGMDVSAFEDNSSVGAKIRISVSPDGTAFVIDFNCRKRAHPYDRCYLMDHEDLRWCGDNGSGLKNKIFPWLEDDVDPSRRRALGLSSADERSGRRTARKRSRSEIGRTPKEKQLLKALKSKASFPSKLLRTMAEENGQDLKKVRVGNYAYLDDGACDATLSLKDGKCEDNNAPLFLPSNNARMDHVAREIERYEGWRKSITDFARYASYKKRAGLDGMGPKVTDEAYKKIHSTWFEGRKLSFIDRDAKGVPSAAYFTHDGRATNNGYVTNYDEEHLKYKRAACEALLRTLSKGGESVLTAPMDRIQRYFFENVFEKGPESFLAETMLVKFDYEQSLFASFVANKANEIRHCCRVLFNFKEFLILYFGVFDVYRVTSEFTPWNYMTSGDAGAGKSYLLKLLEHLLIDRTVIKMFSGSDKSRNVQISQSDAIACYHEAPPELVGSKIGTNNSSGFTGENKVSETKMRMSEQQLSHLVFQNVQTPEGQEFRTQVECVTPCRLGMLVACNVPKGLFDAAIIDRMHSHCFERKMTEDTIPKEEVLGLMDMSMFEDGSKQQEISRIKTVASVAQSLHAIVEKLIGIGAIDDVDLTLAKIIFNSMVKRMKTKTTVKPIVRTEERIMAQIRQAVIDDGLNNLYFSPARDREMVTGSTLLDLEPYLFSQVHHTIYVMSLSMDQLVDPHRGSVLRAGIEGTCSFPVPSWISKMSAVDVDASVALADIYRDDYVSGGSRISWRKGKMERTTADRTTNVNTVDLNYVELCANNAENFKTLIANKMGGKISAGDVDDILRNGEKCSVKVKSALKPCTHDDLVNLDAWERLPRYPENHEFSVVQMGYNPDTRTDGGSGRYKMYFCVHALTSIDDGQEIFEDALKSISYAGLKQRDSVLTGFVQSYQNATFKTASLKPDPSKPFFSIINPTYRNEVAKASTSFNHKLVRKAKRRMEAEKAAKARASGEKRDRDADHDRTNSRTQNADGNPKRRRHNKKDRRMTPPSTIAQRESPREDRTDGDNTDTEKNSSRGAERQKASLLDEEEEEEREFQERVRAQEEEMQAANERMHDKKTIEIYCDLDEWAAKERALKCSMNTVWVVPTVLNETTGTPDFDLREADLAWKFVRSNGDVEIRALPYEHAQRVRNLKFLKNGAFPEALEETEKELAKKGKKLSDFEAGDDFDFYLLKEGEGM
jgi:hypothetical protein